MTRRSLFAPALLTLSLFALPGVAQEAQQIEADIKFAQGLAQRWQFVDLAEEVLDGISAKHNLNDDQSQNLDLVRCEIFATAARRERDPDQREQMFEAAISSYEGFIADNEYSDLRGTAEIALVGLSNSFASRLELKLENLVGEEADQMREKIRTLLQTPLESIQGLIIELEELDEETELDRRKRAGLMLERARILSAMGRVSEDGAFYFGQALTLLEDIAMEFGDNSGWGLQAYQEMARIHAFQGNFDDAVIFYQYVVDAVMPPDEDKWQAWSVELSQSDKDLYWRFAESTIPGMLEACGDSGETAVGTTYALLYYNRFKSNGFTLSTPKGYLGMLSAAKTLLDSGGYVGGRVASGNLRWFPTEQAMGQKNTSRNSRRSAVDMALLIAQMVNKDNDGNTLQSRAQNLIAEITQRPGVVLSPDMLFEAASGHYSNKDYDAAILGCKRVLATIADEDAATRSEFGPQVLNKLGNSFARQKRYLEAIMVFQEAVTNWSGDPEFDNKNAKGMYAAAQSLKVISAGDSMVEALFLKAENHVTRTAPASDTGGIKFTQAKRLYGNKDFEGAFTRFGEVDSGSDSYEIALVYSGASRYQSQKRATPPDYSEAKQIFRDYLDDYLNHPDSQSTSETLLARRLEARTLATFYVGTIAYKEKDWATCAEYLSTFQKDFPGQDQMAPNAVYMALMASLAMTKVPEARALHGVMMDNFQDNKYTGTAATAIYKEVTKLHDAALDGSAGKQDLLQAMAELMQTSNRLSKAPKFSGLRREAGHWIDLENWEAAEAVLRTTSKLFKDDSANRKAWHMNVQPDLGLVLIAQSKLPEAIEILSPLMPPVKTPQGGTKPEFRPYPSTVGNFHRAAVGWIEGDSSRAMTEVLGAGTPADVKLSSEWMSSLSRGKEKYTPDWYQYKFNYIFCLRRLSQTESEKRASAQKQLSTMRNDVGQGFEGITEDYPTELVLRQQYLWLNTELK